MKTTVEVSEALLKSAKLRALEEKTTLKEIFSAALTEYLRAKAPARRFRLKTITTKGSGLQVQGDWDAVRDLLYEDRDPNQLRGDHDRG